MFQNKKKWDWNFKKEKFGCDGGGEKGRGGGEVNFWHEFSLCITYKTDFKEGNEE